jgi:hypothetical protein
MPPGSKPGERRGGRKAGTPNKRTIDITNPVVAEVRAAEMNLRQANKEYRDSKTLLTIGSNLMMGLVAKCREAPRDPVTELPRDPETLQAMFKCFELMMGCAGKLIAHEYPTFKAVHLAIDQGMGNSDRTKTIELKIFEDTGTALGLMEVLKDVDEA